MRGEKRHFLVYRNYEALLAYNCSHSYAITVGLLADKIALGRSAEVRSQKYVWKLPLTSDL